MKDFSELRAEFLLQRLEFIRTELQAGVTFVNVAQTERRMGHSQRAYRSLELAEKAYGEAQHRLDTCDRADHPEAFDAASAQLLALGAAISDFDGP